MTGKMILDKRTIQNMLRFQVFYIFFLRFFVDILRFPSAISYGIDLINLIITGYLLFSKAGKKRILRAGLASVVLSVVLLMVYTISDGIVNFVKPQLMFWAFRNTMRYYPFFFSIITFWDEKTMESMIRFLMKLQYPNFLIVLFQFFVLKSHQDNIGGIFGCISGCNGALNIYLCIVTALSVEKYLHKEIKLVSVLCTMGIFLTCSVLAELKVGFVELPMIIVLAILFNRPSFRTVVTTLAVLLMIPLGVSTIIVIFPQWAVSFMSLDAFFGIGSQTSGGYDISRLNAFSEINDLFFKNDFLQNALGLGFGNCEYSAISFFSSSFHKRYGWLHYRWFTHQMLFLECGYLGILFYAAFFVTLFLWFMRQKKEFGDNNGWGSFGQIMIAICALNFIYNYTLRTDEGYMLYLALAFPCLYYRCAMEKRKLKLVKTGD